jgi:hypothetical protein
MYVATAPSTVVEFFNLVLGTRLSEDDKRDLLAYLYCL